MPADSGPAAAPAANVAASSAALAAPLLSIVIPVKNEEASIPALAAEIARAFAGSEYAFEVVWIDDGSTDRSLITLRALPAPHRTVKLDRNHGQSAAFMAGFEAARGIWVGTLDGDGQNDPADLRRQLDHARQHGADMVNGIRAKRQDTAWRRIASRIANRIRNGLTGETVTDVGCSTRVVRRAALLRLPFFHGMHRFLPTLVRMKGYRIAEIPVGHRPRTAGRSKYTVLGRGITATRDLFGVRWLIARNRVWHAEEQARE